MRELGLQARRPNVGLPLNRARRARRMAWVTAQAPRRFPMRQWRRVFFTDESRFILFRADERRRLYRRRGVRFADACVFKRNRYGGGSVMVWGGIPLVQQHQKTFQHVYARPHVARICQDFLTNNNIVPLDWPPYSPDLFPIEHLWDELDRRIRRRRNTPNTLENSIAGKVGEHPNEKDQRTGELHAKENQGGDKCEVGGTPDTDSL